MYMRSLKQAIFGLFFFVNCTLVASASNVNVSPVRLTFENSKKMDSITIKNGGAEPVTMQMEILSWSQREGKDVLTATRELLGNPPIFTVPAGSSQVIRVGLRRTPDADRELTYRIILEELPPPIKSDFTGAVLSMRMSLPVFVQPEVEAKPVLRWRASRTPQGALKINLTNNGNVHIQIKSFMLSLPESAQPWVTKQSSEYVLSGSSRNWILPLNTEYPTPPPGVTLKLFAKTDAGDIEAKVLIAP
jgi:fimbrial chaperone protein